MSDALQPELGRGTKLGPYSIISEIGSGGMGAVYRARDTRLERDVALKVIRSPYSSDAGRRRRFQVEARAAARLAHPNIVAIYDVGEENATPYIVSELVNGGTLGARLRQGPLRFDEAMAIATSVAQGLAEAHRNAIIHRDLKPENILLTAAGTPKISDFGLSKFLESNTADSHGTTAVAAGVTGEGTILGTPAYMSPEQASGSDADFRSDQFSFGVMLIEMLTGITPFRRQTSVQTLAAILEGSVDFTPIERAAPPAVVAILKRCLAREPKNRYASTDDLVHDLRAAAQTADRPARRVPWRAIAATAIAVLMVAALVAFFVSRPPPAAIDAKIGSLAILPLQNVSGDRSQDYFADGMTDEITAQLSSLRSLRVASRTSANGYRAMTTRLPDVARELGVDGLITGSVVRSGDEARVTIRLIDGRTDYQIWSQSFDAHGADLLSLQREIAMKIADRIRVTVSPAERAQMTRVPTHNPAAYDAYLHATYKQATAVNNREDADAAVRYAEQAIALDPDFAEAYVVLAEACEARMFGSGGGKEYDEKGFVAVEKALSLNPSLADAYLARGNLQYNRYHGYDIAAGIEDYRHALDLSPNSAQAHHALGIEFTHLGKHDEAVIEFRTALRLDPKSAGPKFRLARALWQSNRFAEALETYERYAVGGFEKAVTLTYLGRPDDAWRAIAADLASHRPEEPAEQRLGNSDISSARALLYAMAGKRAEAEQQIARSVALGQNDAHFHHAAFILAAALAEMGDEERAVHFLEIAANTGMPNYPLFRDNPSMVKLHGRKRYEAFMGDLQLRWQQIAGQTR